MLVTEDGEAALEAQECARPEALSLGEARELHPEPSGEVGLADETTDSTSPWLFHKTTRRELYDKAWRQACSDGLLDLVFCNEKQEVTEGAISNIIVEKNGRYFTPPLHCGLLPGVMRARLLAGVEDCALEEKVLYRDDLRQADQIYLCNSVRGVVPVKLRGP